MGVDPIGKVLAGRFRIVSALGAGGMGTVFRAVQEPLEREVALKVIHSNEDDEMRTRFLREARTLACLSDPSIVVVHDFGACTGGVLFLAMELIDGESLRDRLERGRLPVAEGIALLGALARSLSVAHARGVVHRDVKPENIMLPRAGGVKLVDFGIARATAETTDNVTQTGAIIGTPGYVAPEFARTGVITDARADVYALGVIACEVLAGKPPFAAPTYLALVMKHATERAPRLRELDPALAIEPGVESLVLRMLAKTPEERPTAAEIASLLLERESNAAALAQMPTMEIRSTRTPVANRPTLAVIPFELLTGGDDVQWFAHGLTEDLICELGRFKAFHVICSNSSFTYAGKRVSAQRAGEELGVRFVVEGSVRRSGDKIRVMARLVDVETGAQLWAERYDRTMSELFEVQDELTRAIVGRLPSRIEGAQLSHSRGRPTQDLGAYDLLLQSREHHHKGTAEAYKEARALVDEAIAIDASFGQAHAWQCCVLALGLTRGYTADPADAKLSIDALHRAMTLSPDDSECQRIQVEIAIMQRSWDKALTLNERALEFNPNDPRLHAQKGEILARLGRGAEALPFFEHAATLDPHGARSFDWLKSLAYFTAGDLAAAAETLHGITTWRSARHDLMEAVCAELLGERERAKKLLAAAEPSSNMFFNAETFAYRCSFARAEHTAMIERALAALGVVSRKPQS